MKKIIYTAIALLFCSLTSCNILSQESPSSFDAQKVFTNHTLAQSAFDAIWEALLSDQCYSLRYKCFYGANTDIEVNANMDSRANDIQCYNASPTHDRLNGSRESFSIFYKAIERANLVLDGLERYADLDGDEQMRILYAQTLTIRAHIYCDLIRAWGDVPARFKPLSQDEFYKPKVSRDVIFHRVLDDLDKAIDVLPYPGEHAMTSDAYHINKVYAAGLFARIALMASGYAQRPDDGKIGTGDAGKVRLSSDPLLSKEVLYPRAITHLEKVIGDSKMTLAPDYKEYWRKFNNGELAWNPKEESVLVLPYRSSGRWNYTFAVRNSDSDLFGVSVKRSPYTGPAPTFYFDFDRDDKRRNVTCFNFYMGSGGPVLGAGAQWYFGKFRMDQMKDIPFSGENTDSAKPVVMRYSDVLLMAAEIANELGDLDGAKAYMLPVRARAFDEASANAYLATLKNKDDFFAAVVDERAFEFCGEQIRKADLIRWNLLKAKMDSTKKKMYELRDLAGRYSWMPKKVYTKVNPEDSWELLIYGYDKGETSDPGAGWKPATSNPLTVYDDAVLNEPSRLNKTKIESVYAADPDTRQFWPIPANAINNSQGTLVNDYGY